MPAKMRLLFSMIVPMQGLHSFEKAHRYAFTIDSFGSNVGLTTEANRANSESVATSRVAVARASAVSVHTLGGCPRIASAPALSEDCRGDGDTFFVRCCGDVSTVQHKHDTYGGCSGEKTYEQATALCTEYGLHICSVDELETNAQCGAGCGYDTKEVWTSSACTTTTTTTTTTTISVHTLGGCPRSASAPALSNDCRGGDDTFFVRCCGDVGTERHKHNTYGGCSGRKTYAEAFALCTEYGLHICSVDELQTNAQCGAGCGYDTKEVWTSTICTTITTTTGTPFWSMKPSQSCHVDIGDSVAGSGSSDNGVAAYSCNDCSKDCNQHVKQKSIYLSWEIDPPLTSQNIFDVKTRIEWVNFVRLEEHGKNGIYHAMKFQMDKKAGEPEFFGGYMGPQISAKSNGLQGQHLFSMWDTSKPESDGTSSSGRRLAIPAGDPGFCERNCQDCGLHPDLKQAGLTTGTQCKIDYTAKADGQAFIYRIRMSNASAKSAYDGDEYEGAEWEVTVHNEEEDTELVLGRVLLVGDTQTEGLKKWTNFHEHLGCTPCDAFYEKTIVHGPVILEPSGIHTILSGASDGLDEDFECRLHREIALPDFGIQMETGPGVTPAPATDTRDGATLFSCTDR